MNIEVLPGDEFIATVHRAHSLSLTTDKEVSFDFNGVTCIVNKFTYASFIYRDYCNAHIMEWDTVGPDCVAEYPQEVIDELNKRKAAQEKSRKAAKRKQAKKKAADKAAFEHVVEFEKLILKDEEGWAKSVAANQDGYGKAVIDYAEGWAKLMQIELAAGYSLDDCYESVQGQLDFMGISRAQYSAATSLLIHTWIHGEELREALTKSE